MLLRNFVLQPADDVYQVALPAEGNFATDVALLGNNFNILVRTYKDYLSYFTIMLNNTEPLCIMNLARLSVNLCYSPVTTIDNKAHVFYLVSTDTNVTQVHHSLFGKSIFLRYYQEPASGRIVSIILG